MLKNQKGFTLIEIIAVLIILGILAAVAVPKYIDMQASARTKAAQGAIAEIKGRATMIYAKYLLDNNGVQPTVAAIVASVSTDAGSDFGISIAAGTGVIAITVGTSAGAAVSPVVVGTWTMPTT